jgi:hypothetical protein
MESEDGTSTNKKIVRLKRFRQDLVATMLCDNGSASVNWPFGLADIGDQQPLIGDPAKDGR